MKKYKVILNINTNDEKIYFYDSLKSCIRLIKNNYIIMYYDNFLNCYITFDYKLTNEQKEYYNNNVRLYA